MGKILLLLFGTLFPKIQENNLNLNESHHSGIEIVSQDQIFDLKKSITYGEVNCQASVLLKANVLGNVNCEKADILYFDVIVDLYNDGKTDFFASSDVDHDYKGKWVPDQDDNILKTYLPSGFNTGYQIKLPEFLLVHSNTAHTIIWKATDLCGNQSQSVSKIRTRDNTSPISICISSKEIFQFSNANHIEVVAKDFNKISMDNCTDEQGMVWTFDNLAPLKNKLNEEHFYKQGSDSTVLATLDEFKNGIAYKWMPAQNSSSVILKSQEKKFIKLSVWDESWNTDFCLVELNYLKGDPGFLLQGEVNTVKKVPIQSARIIINAVLPEFPKYMTTDQSGHFSATLGIFNAFGISATFDGNKGKRLDHLDYQVLERHLQGTMPFTEYWQMIAADVNMDRMVDKQDLDLLHLSIKNNMNQWVLVPKDQVLNKENWFNYQHEHQHNGKGSGFGGQLTVDFIAIKVGDVDGNVFENITEDQLLTDQPDILDHEWRKDTESFAIEKMYIYPNPISDDAEIGFQLQKNQTIRIEIFNSNATNIYTTNFEGTNGTNKILLQTSVFPSSGVYYCCLRGRSENKWFKIVVAK